MSFSTCLSNSFSHMIQILFTPPRLMYWVWMILLLFMIQGFNPMQIVIESVGIDTSDPQSIETFLQDIESKILLIILLIFLGMLFAIIHSFLAAACSFIFMRGIKEGVVRIVDYFFQHAGAIVSLFLWNIAIGFIIVLGIAVLVGVLSVMAFALGGQPTNMTFVLIGFSCVFGLFGVVIMSIYTLFLSLFVIPQMLVENRGILQSWGRAFGLFFENLAESLGAGLFYLLMGFTMGIIGFVFTMGGSLFLFAIDFANNGGEFTPEALSGNMNSVLMIPFIFVATIVYFPIVAFTSSFALHFMASITGNRDYIPARSPMLDTFTDDGDEPPMEPGSPTGGTPVPPAPTDGPISFSDIPLDTSPGVNPNTVVPPVNPNDSSGTNPEPPKPPNQF